jgi:hypothetical protein
MPVEAIALLGWMEQDEAIDFLCNRCVFDPALDRAQAVAMWQEYRQRVDALPARAITTPQRRNMSPQDRDWERRFLDFTRQAGGNARCVVKVNLFELVVHQKHILTDRAAEYGARLHDSRAWNQICLPIQPEQHQVQVNFRTRDFGLATDIDIDVPDGEWLLLPRNCNGEFHIKPGPALKYVTVTEIEPDRLLLLAGYHRSFARALRAQADGTECPALVALVENVVPPVIPGNETVFDLLVRGVRAPLLADFFDERLFMRVLLRRKRYQMQIRAHIEHIDDP